MCTKEKKAGVGGWGIRLPSSFYCRNISCRNPFSLVPLLSVNPKLDHTDTQDKNCENEIHTIPHIVWNTGDVKASFICNSVIVTPIPVLYDTSLLEGHQKIFRKQSILLLYPPPQCLIIRDYSSLMKSRQLSIIRDVRLASSSSS